MKKNWMKVAMLSAILVAACAPKKEVTTTASKKVENVSYAVGEVDYSERIPNDPSVKTGKLSNGLTYYIKNNGKPEDKVELRLAVNAGSVLEDDDQQGLAHFMEHMNFNGTTHFQKNELIDYLQGIGVKFGADLNAYTSFDETVYILPIPSDDPEKLEQGFTILEDWAHGALLQTEAIEGERGVVLEESRNGKGANDRMNKITIPVEFYGSKYAKRLPIGKDDILKNFKPEVLKRFYKDWYRPDLMAVVAVGDLDVATLEQKIIDHFGKIPAVENGRKRETFNLPYHADTKVAIAQDKEATFASVNVSYKDKEKSPKSKTVKDFRASLVDGLFGVMISNRLQELTTKPNPPFIFASSNYGGTVEDDKRAYTSFAGSSPEGQLEALRAVLTENRRVKLHGFTPGELERAKTTYKSYFESAYNDRDKQQSGRIVGQYVNAFLSEGTYPSIDWSYEQVKKLMPTITLDNVNDRINTYIHDDNRTVILTGPTTEKVPTEAEVLKVISDVNQVDVPAYVDEVVRENLIEELPSPGSIVKTTTDADLGTTTYTLSNGATVTVKPTDFKNDEILMSAFSYGGSSLYSDADYLKTQLAQGGITEAGVAGLDQTAMEKFMTGKLVSVSPFVGGSTEGMRGSATPKDVETMFQLIHVYFTDLNKDDEAYQSYLDKQKSFIGRLLSNPNSYFNNEINEMRNAGNPRYVGFPTAEKYDAADYDKAYELFKGRFVDAGDFNFYLVGNITPEEVATYSKKYLANLPGLNSNEQYKVSTWREKQGTREKTVYKGTEEKSLVRLTWGYEIPKYDAREALLIDALGEALTIKIMEVLREEAGGIYSGGAQGYMGKIPYPQVSFGVSFPCGPENVDKLVAATFKEIETLKKNGPSEKDLSKVKEGYLLSHKDDLKSNNYWLNLLVDADEDKKDPKQVFKYEENVNSITADELKKVANKYLTKDYILAILKPESKK